MVGGLSNISTLTAQRAMQMNALAWATSLTRLATGRSINRAADNPAGLIAAQSLQSTLATLDGEVSANERASNQADVADAALGQVSDLLIEAKGLVLANANDAGLSAAEKQANQLQIDAILSTVDRISGTTHFNGGQLLNGTATLSASGQKLKLDSAASSAIGGVEVDSESYTLADLRTGKALNTVSGDVSAASDSIDQAIHDIATQRGRIGTYQSNQLAPRLAQIASTREHLTAALSLIQDTDYAMELSRSIRYQLLYNTSAQMLGIAMRSGTMSILA